MKNSLSVRLTLVLILLSSLLAGCGLSTPVPWTPVPTQDPATFVAAAVKTIEAQMTEEALRNPTATPPPPTLTPEPTQTPVPPTATVSNLPTNTLAPTATTASALSAEVQYATTIPENKREYVPNERFTLAIGFKNTGTLTWDSGYKIKLVRADGEITVAPEAELGASRAPGEKAEFNLWAFGSETLGQHTWYFQVYTSTGIAVPGGYASFTYTSK